MSLGQPHGRLPGEVSRASTVSVRPAAFCRSAAACLLATLLLSACGGGGGDTAPEVPDSADYFPLAVGNRWLYGGDSGAVLLTLRVNGTTTIDGRSAYTLQSQAMTTGESWESIYAKSATELWQYPSGDDDELTQAVGAMPLMRLDVPAGSSFVQVDRTLDDQFDFDGDGRADRYSIHSEVTVVGHESVDTPVGSFAQALHQRTVTTQTVVYSADRSSATLRMDADDWYAPGVGLVRSSGTLRFGADVQSFYQVLRGYRVGSRASETVAPTIQSVTPASGDTVGAGGTTVSAIFSEAMDLASLTAGGLAVADAQGRAVAGHVVLNDNTATFVPDSPWASGTYTAQVTTTATDLVGNPVASARAWTVTIDATAPTLVSSTPAAGATNASPDAPVVLQFSEPLDPASVNPSSVYLTDGSNYVAVSLETTGSMVTLTPVLALQGGRHYWVHITTGVTDTQGNPLPSWTTIEFDTDQGGFAYPVIVAEEHPAQAVAIGDVNGDGINDLVMTSQIDRINHVDSALFLLAGRLDGTLAPAVQVGPAPIVGGYATSVAIGDVNGDGRTDVVVAGDYAGVQVMLQAPDGSLSTGASFNQAGFGHIRIADIDGDGRSDVVGTSGGVDRFSVLHQEADGQLALGAGVALGGGGASDLEVADVNGDGRADLLAVTSQDLVVATQNVDGSFASPVRLPADPIWGAWSLAAGDFNGDGRTDVAVSTGGNSPTSIGVYYQGSDGVLGAMQPVATYDIPFAIRAADIDGDGRADLVVSHRGWHAVGVYLQSPDGTLKPERLFRGPYGNLNTHSLAVGDLNRDGRADILIENSLLIQQGMSPARAQRQAPAGVNRLRPITTRPPVGWRDAVPWLGRAQRLR